ncbi:Abi family protein [Pseudomonas brassicacearum]|uniref:hypothetical protein n=1 Tax=Pseudomonas brassicacearum TaxID=930166 RepID=UPI003467C041
MSKSDKVVVPSTLARLQALSYARLSNYRSFFGVSDDAQVLGLYEWNEDVSAVLFRTLSRIEIVLRNRFHGAMSQRYGIVGSAGSKDWYLHVALNPLSSKKIGKITHHRRGKHIQPKVPAPTPDDVISRLTLGFWPHLLDLERDVHHRLVDWGPILIDVLPGHRQRQAAYWAKLKHRDALFARLDLCNELRNRIAHHEPVWKLGPLMEEGRYRTAKPLAIEAAAPSTPIEMLVRLQLIYGRLTELLQWLSPDIAALHLQSELHYRCLSLLRLEALNCFFNV